MERYAAEVLTPEGEKFAAGEANFTQYLVRRFGHSLRPRFSERSMTDAAPVSIFGLATVRGLVGGNRPGARSATLSREFLRALGVR